MSVAVIIPFESDDPHRVAALLTVLSFYATEFPDWPVMTSPDPDSPPFSRARAINAAARATDADILVINDADSLTTPDAMLEAVKLAERPGLVRAYTSYRRLTRDATEALTPDGYLDAFQGPFDWEMENAHAHGCVAVRRDCFEQVGGYDPKFQGWGYEDLAAEMLYDAFWPDRRVAGDLVHLWHPAVSEGPDVDANAALYYGRYEQRRGDREGLLALRREAA